MNINLDLAPVSGYLNYGTSCYPVEPENMTHVLPATLKGLSITEATKKIEGGISLLAGNSPLKCEEIVIREGAINFRGDAWEVNYGYEITPKSPIFGAIFKPKPEAQTSEPAAEPAAANA